YQPGCPKSQPAALAADAVKLVTVETAKGSIVIKITGSLSPIATGNFVALADCGYYDGVIFHRVVKDFVIQGGDGMFGRSPDIYKDLVGSGGPPYTIKDEPVTTTYHRGTVAMARTAVADSVRAQFFIVLSDGAATALAGEGHNNYQIVGEVSSGMDVVDAIAAAANGKEQPDSPVVMTKVTVHGP
ncbi:MAG: peptidylprolyl isomerase, partial [Chloroflexota bacterium]